MQSAQTELDFIKFYLETLSDKSVRYGDDYLARKLPSPLRIKRVPVSPVIVKEPIASETKSESQTPKLQVTVKVLKPSSTFTIGSLSPKDTVHQLKQRIYQQQSSLPVNRQRLLIKGKVLADQKSLEELSINEGTVIHLMVTAAPATPVIGRFGVSAETEKKMSTPEFWAALEKTIIDQVGEVDAKLVFSKVKSSLSA
ncbi:ubiquitin-related domain-containing protein [Mucor mucedo]|uniref:ubiquitin-related domain-containing protein n=1 Tax=Mucor mucedo TaxID=29922 RepID=UPI00221FAF18|nr:ubiquitin-related domain-containing protein [Mucor mucedo]KAI7875091.1 ubiquitin-related domain-containing protein [Mucor mucedo]